MARYTYYVTNDSSIAYVFTGIAETNPNFTFQTGDVITFNVSAPGHPFWIKTSPTVGSSNIYNDGVTNNGTDNGQIVFVIPSDAPAGLYYQCGVHKLMNGIIFIQPAPTTTTTTTTTTVTTTTATTTTTTTFPPVIPDIGTTPTPVDGPTTSTTTKPPFYFDNVSTSVVATEEAFTVRWSEINFPSDVISYEISCSARDSGNFVTITFTVLNIDIYYPDSTPGVPYIDLDGSISLIMSTSGISSFGNSGQDIFYKNIPLSYIPKLNVTYDISLKAFLKNGEKVEVSTEILRIAPTTTSTTTTTDSPLDVVQDRSNLNECPCGIVNFPKGSLTQDTDGLSVMLSDDAKNITVDLLHGVDVLLSKGQKFVTVSNTITENVIPKSITLFIDTNKFSRLQIENAVQITIKDFETREILSYETIGSFGTKTKIARSLNIDKPSIHLPAFTKQDLIDNAIIIEIQSLCEYDKMPCCDSLPSDIQVFGSGLVCLPLDRYYLDDLNPVTTTTPHPDTVEFVENLSATLEGRVATLRAVVDTYYHSDFTYFVEILNNDCTTRLVSSPLTGKSNEEIVFTDDTYGSNNYRIFISTPQELYSNTVLVVNTTTTIAPPTTPDPNYTTAPPPSTPYLEQLSYDFNNNWGLSWDLNNEISQLEKITISYRSGDPRSSWTEIEYVPTHPDWFSLVSGANLNISTTDCLEYEFKVTAYKSRWSFADSNYQTFIVATLPSAPQSLSADKNAQDDTQLDISWSAPIDNGLCASLIYRIEYRADGSNTWTLHDDDYASTSVSVTGLDASTTYYARVAAINLKGQGPFVSTDPYTQMLLHLEDAFYRESEGLMYTPDSSSYSRIVEMHGCNTGYIVEPDLPQEYFGSNLSCLSDVSKFGDHSFYSNPDSCPADIAWDINTSLDKRVRLTYDSDLHSNSRIILHDGNNSKYTVEFWIKIPTISQKYPTEDLILFTLHGDDDLYKDISYGNHMEMKINFNSASSANIKLSMNGYFENPDSNVPSQYSWIQYSSPINATVFQISDNDWHHVAIVVDGTLNNATDNKFVQVYLDGLLKYNTSVLHDFYDINTSQLEDTNYYDLKAWADRISIGGYYGSYWVNEAYSACFYMDEFRLSSDTLYCQNFTPPSQPLDQINQEPC